MDAVAFPPPPAPFLDDDFDFGDFTFASPAPQPATFDDDWGDFVASPLGSNPDGSAPATPPTVKSSTWEKLRAPLPLSLFGADDEDADEGPAEPPPPATTQQRVPSASFNGSKPADLKDLIAGLYGSQPPSTPDAAEASAPEADDDDGFGDGGWEFKTAPSAAGQDGIGRALEDGIEDVPKSLGSDQENWSSSTSVNEKSNHVLTTYRVGIRESTGQSVKAFSHSPSNNAAILDLFKERDLVDAVHVTQSSAESVQSSSDLFSNNEMDSSFETDENHSIKSTGDSIFIDFYHRLREESLTVISRHVNGLKEAQKGDVLSAENSEVTTIGKEIQEIYGKLQDFSLPKGFCIEEHRSRDVCIDELVNSTKEEHLKDFEREYHLAEGITSALEDVSMAVELYKHSVSTLHTLQLASKEEQCDYVGAWYSLLLSCAQELQYGAMIWQESCRAGICDRVIFKGGHCFVALGEIYRVAQILHFSLQCFKPWVLSDPGMLSKMLACLDSCTTAWTSGLEMALKMVVDGDHSDASVAKALLESIKNINDIEEPNPQKFLPNDDITCRLTLLPTIVFPGKILAAVVLSPQNILRSQRSMTHTKESHVLSHKMEVLWHGCGVEAAAVTTFDEEAEAEPWLARVGSTPPMCRRGGQRRAGARAEPSELWAAAPVWRPTRAPAGRAERAAAKPAHAKREMNLAAAKADGCEPRSARPAWSVLRRFTCRLQQTCTLSST